MQRSNKDIVLLSVLACFWAVQAAVVLREFLGMWKAPLLINNILLPEAVQRMSPKWEALIYFVSIAVALTAGKMLFRYYHKPINYWLLVFEGVIAFFMISAFFKMLIYFHSPQLAHRFLVLLTIISIVSKIFYPEFKEWTRSLYHQINRIAWLPYADAWWIAVIVLTIYMPDLQRVIGMMYMGENLHHFDFLVMSVGWASLWGQLPYVDVISQYGVGLPVIFAKIINAFGGFEYVPALRVMMWFVIIYFILTYFLVRYWLKSALIAGVAYLLVFRMQMFHYGVSPLVWAVPSASPLRFGLDILWLAALLQHMRSRRSRWLIFAALYSGFAPYYMTSVGMALMATFYIYLLALIILPSLRRQVLSGSSKRWVYYLCWVLPLISAFVFFGITFKGHMFQKEFWHNLFDYMVVFGHFGAIPMWESLKFRHFWAFIMSMVMPFTFVATLLYTGACLYLEKGPSEWMFTFLLCIYGLANYEYYAVRAAITSYYVGVLPFVLVVCFWFRHCLEFLPLAWQRRARAAAIALSFYALLTNQNYLAYPNLMNFSRNPMTDNMVIQRFPDLRGYFNMAYRFGNNPERLPVNDLGQTQDDLRIEDDFKSDADMVDFFKSHFDFKEDAALIRQLTKPGERVALISSSETEILIEANRPPFFYHFPLILSRPMTFRTFPADAAQVPSFPSDTVNELKERRPLYVFMEKVFLQDLYPPSYQDTRWKVLAIIAYVRGHYQPVSQGKYLVAMKRKD